MAIKRTSAVLLILAAAQSLIAPALAETIELPPHTHREKYLDHNTNEVLKDFEWTTTPVITVRDDGDVWIRITHRCTAHVDKPHEDDNRFFERQKNCLDRIEILLGNGRQWNLAGTDKQIDPNTWEINYPVGKQQVLLIVAKAWGLRSAWSFQWSVRRPTQSREQAISQATQAVDAADEMPRVARLRLMGRIVGLLAPHSQDDHDVAVAASVIDLQRERWELLDDKLEGHLDKIRNAADQTQREEAWRALRREMLQRSTRFMQSLAASDIKLEDARRLIEIVKYGSQAVDDLKDLSPKGGATSEVTRFVAYAHGIAALAEGVENQDARLIMGGLRDTVGNMEKTIWPLGVARSSPVASILDMPGEVAASMIDVSREGLDQVTETMEHIDAGLDGDQAALGRAVESSREIEQILSSENYGRAMEEAITDRIVDKIPFLRTIAAWFK